MFEFEGEYGVRLASGTTDTWTTDGDLIALCAS